MTIDRPRFDANHPDYFLECQEAIEDDFRGLVDQAVDRGWHEDAVAAALIDLSYNHMLSRAENDRVNDLLKRIMKDRDAQ